MMPGASLRSCRKDVLSASMRCCWRSHWQEGCKVLVLAVSLRCTSQMLQSPMAGPPTGCLKQNLVLWQVNFTSLERMLPGLL